jgi:hypothetical protein
MDIRVKKITITWRLRKMTKKIMKNIMGTMKVGTASMVGGFALGSMANMPGMPVEAKGIASTGMSGMQLANIGMLGKTGMDVAGMFSTGKKSKKNKWM